MKRFIRRRPRPGTIIAIVALIVALAGTAVAAGPFLPKQKFVKFKGQVLKTLTYATNTTSLPDNVNYPGTRVAATCPSGYHVIGGGIKVSDETNADINDSYPTTTGWAGNVNTYGVAGKTATTTAICALTKSSTGSPPSS
jgi:hypothetical protein